MRGLMWVILLVAGLWAGYWVVGSRAVQSATESWFQAEVAAGRQASHEGVAVRGFPNRFDLTVTAPRLFDPKTGLGWQAPFAQVFAMGWKPWHLIAALPNEQVIVLPDQRVDLSTTRMRGSLLLVPGPDMALREAVAEADGLRAASDMGWVLAAERAVLSSRADAARAGWHRLGLSVTGLAPDPEFARAIGLPAQLSTLFVDAQVGLSAPIDRQFATQQPRMTGIEVTKATLAWGGLGLKATGALAPDAAGYAAGSLKLTVENWRLLLPVLVETGIIAADAARQIEGGMALMANGNTLDVTLTLRAGQVFFGPLPLGPAPYWG